MSTKRSVYVWMERIGDGPKIRGYDSYLTTWDSYLGILNDIMDEHPSFGVKLTVLQMTATEYERFCRDHEIDMTGDLAGEDHT